MRLFAEPHARHMRKRLTHCFVLVAESNNGRTVRDSAVKYAKESDRSGKLAPGIRAFSYLALGLPPKSSTQSPYWVGMGFCPVPSCDSCSASGIAPPVVKFTSRTWG